eukprot:1147139-Pelagomonas_calceolata.AAC.2
MIFLAFQVLLVEYRPVVRHVENCACQVWLCGLRGKADLDGYIELLACNVQSPSAPIRSSAHEQNLTRLAQQLPLAGASEGSPAKACPYQVRLSARARVLRQEVHGKQVCDSSTYEACLQGEQHDGGGLVHQAGHTASMLWPYPLQPLSIARL